MRKLIALLGWALVLVSALALTPLLDLLPVEVWAWLTGSAAEGVYYRVVTAEGQQVWQLLALAIGIALIALARRTRRSK